MKRFLNDVVNVIMELQKEYSNRAEKEALLELVYIDKEIIFDVIDILQFYKDHCH